MTDLPASNSQSMSESKLFIFFYVGMFVSSGLKVIRYLMNGKPE